MSHTYKICHDTSCLVICQPKNGYQIKAYFLETVTCVSIITRQVLHVSCQLVRVGNNLKQQSHLEKANR